MAPPASGKTSFLLDIFNQLPNERWVFLSPLRALAEEFYLRTRDILPTQNYLKQGNDEIIKKGLIITTPEQVDDRLCEEIKDCILIVDEMHLWAHWGDSFRYTMWEAYYQLMNYTNLVIHMTATVNVELRSWIDQTRCHFDEILYLDYGNNQMRFEPNKIIYYPKMISPDETIKRKINQTHDGCLLVFCAYRNEVKDWMSWAKKNNIPAISCVGGGARDFQKSLLSFPDKPKLILSTTVLSHGVNLPEISGVYFTYQVKDPDFWLQMVTRGGRRGQRYEVLTLDKEFINPSRRYRAFFAMILEEFITRLVSFFNCEGPWSWKELSPEKFPIKNET